MRNLALVVVSSLLAFPVATSAAPPETVASTPPRTPDEEKALFHLPPGFVAQLVAAEPVISKPMNLAFDDRGRLWVTDTLEYPFPAPPGQTPRDTVKVLADFGPDGRARSVTTFATGLNIPIGLIPMPGGREALVHGIPNISRFIDRDGDGRADERVPVFQTYGSRDTHGMTNAFTWGFDGWIYACHGFANESRVEGADKRPITMQSGNTYRMRADGSRLEYVTHGQVNPFGLAFDPLGNLYSSDCHSRPVYQLLRGAWYPSFGKPHDGLGFGPEMCFHDHGSTGIAGIVYYAATQFPAPHRGSIYVGNVVTSRINQDTIEWKGATPRAIEQPDFLVSDDPWFRPVDLELGPDGALYVADFYNKIIGHYEVPLTHPGRDRSRGRIWRIAYVGEGGQAPAPPRDITKDSNETLIASLADPNLTVRSLASNALLARGRLTDEIRDRLRASVTARRSADERVHALWALERDGGLDDATLASALGDDDRTLRVHSRRVLAERPRLEPKQVEAARAGLRDRDPFVQRASAEALGRHPDPSHVKLLLDARRAVPSDDTHLLHVVRMALRDQLRDDGNWARVDTNSLTDPERTDLADIATGIPSSAAARYLLGFLTREGASPELVQRGLHHAARYLEPAQAPELLRFLEGSARTDRLAFLTLLRSVQQGTQERGAELDPVVTRLALATVNELLGSTKDREIGAAIEAVGAFRFAGARDRLTELIRSRSASQSRRDEALTALAAATPDTAPGVLKGILEDAAAPLVLRERAATLLGQSGRPEAQTALTEALPVAPERVQTAIAAGLAARKSGAEGLLQAIAAGKASARLLQAPRVFGPLNNAGIPNLQPRLDALTKGLPPADARINDLINRRRVGFAASKHDAVAGAKVFETHCAACHLVAGKGAKVGPQLDGIGGRGPDRLVEDILDPSRNVDQAFRQTNLALKDGRVVSGLLLREEGAVLVMADAQGKEVRVPAETVEERSMTPLSPMPANFAEQIPEADFHRLIDFLMERRGDAPPAATP